MVQMLPLLGALCIFMGILWLGMLGIRWREKAAKRRSLAIIASYASADVHEALQEVAPTPSIISAGLLALGYKLVSPKAREKLTKMAALAGRPGFNPDDMVKKKVIYMLFGLMMGLLLGVSKGGLVWLTLPAFGAFGFYIPNVLLYNEAQKRDQVIALLLPDALDMLNLCVESGLSFQAALGQVALNQTGPVADEFSLVLQEMQYGRSRSQALYAMGMRTQQEDVERFISAMMQVDKMGVPVSTVLREQAKEMRAKRYSRAREQAQKVPVKILAPLMLCFLPALFIIILGPAVVSIADVFSKANGTGLG